MIIKSIKYGVSDAVGLPNKQSQSSTPTPVTREKQLLHIMSVVATNRWKILSIPTSIMDSTYRSIALSVSLLICNQFSVCNNKQDINMFQAFSCFTGSGPQHSGGGNECLKKGSACDSKAPV